MTEPTIPTPDPIDNSGMFEEEAEVGDDVVTTPNPYDDHVDEDDGSDPDAYLG